MTQSEQRPGVGTLHVQVVCDGLVHYSPTPNFSFVLFCCFMRESHSVVQADLEFNM